MDKFKRKRSSAEKLFARYKTYEGEAGSPEQWAAQAVRTLKLSPTSNLSLLGLTHLPSTLDELKKARRKAMVASHPDKGGPAEVAVAINQAFEQLSRMFPSSSGIVTSSGLVVPPRCTATLPTDLTSEDLVAELKIDGERFILYIGFDPYGRREGNTILSRHKSSYDGRYVDRTDNIPHITAVEYMSLNKTVLDGEVFLADLPTTASIMGSTPAESAEKQLHRKMVYYAFDISYHKGTDVRHLPLRERWKLLESVVSGMGNSHVKVVQQWSTDIKVQFDTVVENGGEGLVIKNLNSQYGYGWSKMKKSVDVSCVVSGYRPGKKALEGMVGSLEISVFNGDRLVSVGFVSGFTNGLIQDMTANLDKYMGRVIDVFAHEVTKDGKLRSPTFHRFRNDMNPEDCTMEKVIADTKVFRNNRTK